MLAQVTFAPDRLVKVSLYPVWLGYGENVRTSGTPRLERRPLEARGILKQIEDRTEAFGLPALGLKLKGVIGTIQ